MRLATAERSYRHAGPPAERAAAMMGLPVLRRDLQGGMEVLVRVNHGRWIVDCPFCSSAQIASFTDRRFLCAECGNVQVDGRWLTVVWPTDPEAIEAVLLPRPTDARNWSPGESVVELQAENLEHGIGG